MNNTTIVPVNQVIELGKVTVLTLGDGHRNFENNWRSRGALAYNENTVELGNAAELTLGFGRSRWETSSRPNNRE
jgi:hypothetical protein